MSEVVQKELRREELENFYIMVRSYYPNAVMGLEPGSTGFSWLFGYDETERRVGVHNGSAMVMGTESGTRYYVGVSHGKKTERLCRTTSRKRFMSALKKLSSADWGKRCK